MLKVKAISSLEKVLLGDQFEKFSELKSIHAARGERASFQIVVETIPTTDNRGNITIKTAVSPDFEEITTVDEVGYIPSEFPVDLLRADDDYLTKTPGLFPDALYPVKDNTLKIRQHSLHTLFLTLDIPQDMRSDSYDFAVTITDTRDESEYTVHVTLHIANVTMPANDLLYTQWMHCDSIADYFGVEMMSERHWTLIEQYIKTAARTGVTMMLTPLFTPPLDTAVGGQRPTMQLVHVELKNDEYHFDFSLFDRWVEMCHKYGIRYFEMSHLYTQWGVECCPKIIVEVNGQNEHLFGWHTKADGVEYKTFLSQFLPAFTSHLKTLGIDKNVYFHISDEPSLKREYDFDNYKKAKEFLAPYLVGFKMMDALSNIEFYDKGLIEIPVCATNHIEPFMERDIKERWCYYCCSQGEKVGNRFFAMPSYRNRILGIQMYVADMIGFLHWGYNFYYSAGATKKLDPYICSDGDLAWPSGDTYSVYPYDGKAIESIRTKVFYDALQDRMLLKKLEEKIGRTAVLDLINEIAGEKIDFSHYPRSADFLIKLHDAVLAALA